MGVDGSASHYRFGHPSIFIHSHAWHGMAWHGIVVLLVWFWCLGFQNRICTRIWERDGNSTQVDKNKTKRKHLLFTSLHFASIPKISPSQPKHPTHVHSDTSYHTTLLFPSFLPSFPSIPRSSVRIPAYPATQPPRFHSPQFNSFHPLS